MQCNKICFGEFVEHLFFGEYMYVCSHSSLCLIQSHFVILNDDSTSNVENNCLERIQFGCIVSASSRIGEKVNSEAGSERER